MFDAFPDNPFDSNANGVCNLSDSFERALASLKRDEMRVQRYDVRDERGVWDVRWWKPANWPVLDDDGSVIAIVHHVLDVTEAVLAQSTRVLPLDLISRADVAHESAHRLRSEATALRERSIGTTKARLRWAAKASSMAVSVAPEETDKGDA